MTFEPVDYGDDEYETAATRPRPRRPRMDLFSHVQPTNRVCRGWDGHTTEEKYARIDAFAAQLAEGPF